jgi:predicted glycosyltransferase
MRIWIDLANSPHPLLFAPVAARLEELGHKVLLTARDHAQTVELARERWPAVDVIGSESPGGRGAKAAAIGDRTLRLAQWARGRRLDVALSHNSYAQIVAARALGLGVRTVTAMDYEFQPSNHLAFRAAHRVLLPGALPTEAVRHQGARPRKVVHYPGLKEHIHLAGFLPDTGILGHLGMGLERVEGQTREPLVVVRTPPSRAIYHHEENRLFVPLLEHVCAVPEVTCVVLARHPEQHEQLEALGLNGLRVPRHAVDARSLMYAADAVIGAGGTMTREAALLGAPTYSVFAGRRPAVDLWLERRGLLTQIDSAEQFPPIRAREQPPDSLTELRKSSASAIDGFVAGVTGG